MSGSQLHRLLDDRYADAAQPSTKIAQNEVLRSMAARGSCRSFQNTPVPYDLLETLSAVALAAPSKSDLQQRDIIFATDQSVRQSLANLVAGQAWVANAPMIAIFCGNNRRQRLLHTWRDVPFANDHLDAFFNASVDAAIALGAFVTAAEAVGLGCCPISAVRNEAQAVSDMLQLPDHVFPIAGLAIGYPSQDPTLSKRLPLKMTVHKNRYQETDIQDQIQDYDQRREAAQPYAHHRYPDSFEAHHDYGWSEDKIRQYSRAERADFGAFVRAKGFRLD